MNELVYAFLPAATISALLFAGVEVAYRSMIEYHSISTDSNIVVYVSACPCDGNSRLGGIRQGSA